MIYYNGLKFLPLLEYTENLFPRNHLEDNYLLACQHILPSTHMMLRSMFSMGLKKNNCAVIGKCYSTDKFTMKNMSQEGIYVCDSSKVFEPKESFDSQFRNNIRSFLQSQLERMNPPKNANIIILDDGAELLSVAQDLVETYPNLYGVEQTSSGYHKLAYTDIRFPIRNVALSKEKLNFESPFIASEIIKTLESKVSLSHTSQKQILLVGNGFIGKEVFLLLQKPEYSHHLVKKFDIIEERSDIDYLDFSNFDIILGATGNKMMTHNYFDSLKQNVTLASLSSSDREFDASYLRQLAGGNISVHDDVTYKGITLLNCGFPLNFNGSDNVSVPLLKIQLVCALLLLGVCDYKNFDQGQKSFLQLDKKFVEKITQNFQ